MKVLDLFSGIGGFSLGLERAGMETVAFCEYDEKCRQVLKKHWPDVPIFNDVRKLYRFASDCSVCEYCLEEPFCDLCETHFGECECYGCSEFDDEIGSIDVISAGFPCQDISVGHTWSEALGLGGERSGLWSEVVRLTDVLRPKWVIGENVAALRSRGLARCLQDLWAVGYDAEWHIISAASVGADHLRERVFIIAYPQGERIQGLWPEGFQITRPLDEKVLSIRDSNGQWKAEPDFRRETNGVPGRVDRLKQLGNAVVPQIPEIIGRAIMEAA